jgi:hypothetical protein
VILMRMKIARALELSMISSSVTVGENVSMLDDAPLQGNDQCLAQVDRCSKQRRRTVDHIMMHRAGCLITNQCDMEKLFLTLNELFVDYTFHYWRIMMEQVIKPDLPLAKALGAMYFDYRHAQLSAFEAEHGHARGPYINVDLEQWMDENQYQYNAGTLTKVVIDSLNVIDSSCMENGLAKMDKQRLEQLSAFKDVHGHTHVPFTILYGLREWMEYKKCQ